MSKRLADLSSDARPLMEAWIAGCIDRGIQVTIVQTLRTAEQHAANLAAGTSGTTFSLHLPRRLRVTTLVDWPQILTDDEKSDAMDLAPYAVYHRHGPDKLEWDASHPDWKVIGEEAERLGLRWGGRWKRPFDPGHAEFVLPAKRLLLAEERMRPFPTFRA